MSHYQRPDLTDPRIAAAVANGCAESQLTLSRRAMLGVSAGLFSWACMPRIASAATSDPRLLVVVLRGGMDGLGAVAPYGEGNIYVEGRGELYIRSDNLIKLSDTVHSNFFGLHPALKTFGAMYDAGDASVVHATAVPLWTRSHFDCQDNLESGYPGIAGNPTGWLNRLLKAMPSGAPVRDQGAIEIGSAPLILRGAEPVLGWSASTLDHVVDPTLYMIRTLYKAQDKGLFNTLELGLQAQGFAEGLGSNPANATDLQMGFLGAGRLLASPTGPRIATLSVDGWDTHTDQGTTDGALAATLAELDNGLALFRQTIGDMWGQTVVLMVTEFGRMVANNGNHGSDHGVGTVALLAGGAVAGRKVVTKWPGLGPTQLYEKRDLLPTIDLRSVFKGVLREHLDVPDGVLKRTVFPDSSTVKPLTGLIKGA